MKGIKEMRAGSEASKELQEKALDAKSISQKIQICYEVFQTIMNEEKSVNLLSSFLDIVQAPWFSKKEESENATDVDFEEGNEDSSNIASQFSEADIQYYLPKYLHLIKGIIDYLSNGNDSEKEYYSKLWNAVQGIVKDASALEKGLSIYLIAKDPRTPYYQIKKGIRIDNGVYGNKIDAIYDQVKKLHYVLSLVTTQKTETASHILDILDELETKEEKAILLSCLITILRDKDDD